MPSRVLRADLLLLLTAAIWGSAFVAQRLGMDAVGPMLYNGLRFLLGALVVLPLALRPERGVPHAHPLSGHRLALLATAAGSVLFIGASLQQLGLLYTSVANAGFITGLYVILVPVFGWLLLRHRIMAGTWGGAALAVGGMYLLSVQSDFTVAPGDWLQLLGACFWAAHVLLIDAIAPRTHAVRLACIQFFVCAALSLLAAVMFEPIRWADIVAAAPAVAYGGVCSVGIAYTLQVIAQKDAPAAHAAILMSLEALFAALTGWWILDEGLTPRAIGGCALMLVGTLVAQLSPLLQRRTTVECLGTPR